MIIGSISGPDHVVAQAPFRIVVIEGEDAVNIIQQKTAVAPVVEVRDRNDLPVAGVPVTFAISGQNAAFAGGVQQVTIVTNAAGRAIVAGLNPVASGSVEIGVTAAYQGQTAAITISQTNVLTAAQGASAAGGAAGGGAGGGGLSNTAVVGIVGGAAAAVGVAVAASSETAPAVTPPASSTTFNGSFDDRYVVTFTHVSGNVCRSTRTVTGTLSVTLEPPSGATATGSASFTGSSSTVATTCQFGTLDTVSIGGSALPVSGTRDGLAFSQVLQSTGIAGDGSTVSRRFGREFTGAVSGDSITGTFTFSERQESATEIGDGSVAIPVTLRR